MSLRPTTTAAAERDDAVHAVIAAARAADRAFRDQSQQAPTGVTRPPHANAVAASNRPKAATRGVKRIPLDNKSKVEDDGVTYYFENVYLLDLLTRLDGAHDPLCGGASVNGNVVVGAARGEQTVGPWGVLDCNVNGYLMTKSTALGASPDAFTAPPRGLDAAPMQDQVVNVEYGGAFPKKTWGQRAGKKVQVASTVRSTTENLTFRALKPFMEKALAVGRNEEDALRDMCKSAGHVPQGATYGDYQTDENGVVKKTSSGQKIAKPDAVRATDLEDFVDNLCLDVEQEGLLPGEKPLPNGPEHPQRLGHDAAIRKGRPTKDDPLRTRRTTRSELPKADPMYKKGNKEPAWHQQKPSIGASSFGEELAKWTTWAILDTAGIFPRGAIFVRHVTLKVAYETWPKLPIFKPPHVGDDDWIRYMSILRRERIIADYELAFPQPPAPFPWAAFTSAVKEAGLESICPFSFNGDPKLTGKFAHYFGHNTRAGSEDYLYTTLVCASSREPNFEPGKGDETNFGNTLLKAADALASLLGMRRLVLSALPPVVGYYNKVHEYSPCSRTGLDLTYATWTYGIEKTKWPGTKLVKSTYMSHGSRTIDIYYGHDLNKLHFCVPKDYKPLIWLQTKHDEKVDKNEIEGQKHNSRAADANYISFPSPKYILNPETGDKVATVNQGPLASTFRDKPCIDLEEGKKLYEKQCDAVTIDEIKKVVTKVEDDFAAKQVAYYKEQKISMAEAMAEAMALRARGSSSPDRVRDPSECKDYLTKAERVECVLRQLLLDYANDLSVQLTNPPLSYADSVQYVVRREELRAKVAKVQTEAINKITTARRKEKGLNATPEELGYNDEPRTTP